MVRLASIEVADPPSAADVAIWHGVACPELVERDGETVQTYEYSVFGEPAASDPNHPNPYLFTARRFDPETGLYHYRARAYNATIGRFLQTDPASQGMNAYTYCANSPVGRVDPSGLAHYNVLYYVDPHRPQNPKWWLLTGKWDIAGIHHQFGIHSGMYKIFSRTFFPPDGAGNSITVYYAKSHSSAGFASTSYKSGTGVPIDGLTGITRYLGMMQDLIADACDWNATDPSTMLARNGGGITLFTSIGGSVQFGWTALASLGLAVDDTGDVALTYSYGGGAGTPALGLDFSGGAINGGIEDLQGWFMQAGASGGVGATFGADYLTNMDGTVAGGQLQSSLSPASLAVPLEMHTHFTSTEVVYLGNIPVVDMLAKMYNTLF